jgi:hypothetical protein
LYEERAWLLGWKGEGIVINYSYNYIILIILLSISFSHFLLISKCVKFIEKHMFYQEIEKVTVFMSKFLPAASARNPFGGGGAAVCPKFEPLRERCHAISSWNPFFLFEIF